MFCSCVDSCADFSLCSISIWTRIRLFSLFQNKPIPATAFPVCTFAAFLVVALVFIRGVSCQVRCVYSCPLHPRVPALDTRPLLDETVVRTDSHFHFLRLRCRCLTAFCSSSRGVEVQTLGRYFEYRVLVEVNGAKYPLVLKHVLRCTA